MTSSGTTFPPSFTGRTPRGCSVRRSSSSVKRPTSMCRSTFGPPAAEPAQPPMNIMASSTSWVRPLHSSKSAVA